MKKFRNYKDFLMILGLSLASILIFVLVFNNNCFDKLGLGQFGDFYGGVVATLAAIVAGVFLYKTYTNSKKDSDFKIINSLFDHIVQSINNIQYRKHKDINGNILSNDEIYVGLDALYNFDNAHFQNPNAVLNHLNSILDSFENIIFLANKVLYKYTKLKEITLKRIYFLYYSNILWPIWDWGNSKEAHKKDLLQNLINSKLAHDDSKKYIFKKYAELSIKTINFLSDDKRNLIDKKPDILIQLEKLKNQ